MWLDSAADHPRSRGVYSFCCRRRTVPRGSSPLARGLRAAGSIKAQLTRIIPARAGFTVRRSSSSSGPPDHPRSRGVYRGTGDVSAGDRGSSPLARGLPLGDSVGTSCPRIIPARAGFTGGDPVPGVDGWDHPRSRGVYGLYIMRSSGVQGSSPLARGLRRRGIAVGHHGPDHPRSRGVYRVLERSKRIGRGSSPLARGLHELRGQGRCRCRIIPARAGFTIPEGGGGSG